MTKSTFPRPLDGSYGVMLTIAILAISPFIVVTTAAELYQEQIAADLKAGLTALSIVSGLGLAGYAFGALLGGWLGNKGPALHSPAPGAAVRRPKKRPEGPTSK